MAVSWRRLLGARLLIVDDDAHLCEILRLLLSLEGATAVVTCVTGQQAAAASGYDGPFDIVLTDLGLPDIPGAVLIRQILATAGRRPFVVVLTGSGDGEQAAARAAGANVILTKPVQWTSLLAALSERQEPPAAA
ncbi:MAG TPA: response regulator [Methylomirabilota bacterium]|jgi:DNA-binding response OmpR family regulator